MLVQSGFTSESDPFSGPANFFEAFSSKPDSQRLLEGMGRDYEITLTDMKRFPVGAPIQAAADATLKLLARGLTPKDIKNHSSAACSRSEYRKRSKHARCQRAIHSRRKLIDGTLKFGTAHSQDRMRDPAVLELKKRIALVEDSELTAQKRTREANLEVVKMDGTIMQEHGVTKGAIENPMTREEVEQRPEI